MSRIQLLSSNALIGIMEYNNFVYLNEKMFMLVIIQGSN